MRTNIGEKLSKIDKWIYEAPLIESRFMYDKNKLTNEIRWYIIGKYCEMEKYNRKNKESVHELLSRIGQDIGYSEVTLRRFVSYFKALEYLHSAEPDIVSDIFSGELKISIENVRNLARKPSTEIRKAVERVRAGKERMYEIFPERGAKRLKKADKKRRNHTAATVKDIPKYDPDAQVKGLTYTIPSWVKTIERMLMSENIYALSKSARNKFYKELLSLKNAVEALIKLAAEVKQ